MKKPQLLHSDDYLIEVDPVNLVYPEEPIYGGYGAVRDEKLRFRQILITLRRYWKMILLITVLITGIVIVYVAQKPVIYKTQSRVQVNSETVPNIGTKSGSSVFVSSSGSDPVYFTTQFQILEGQNMLRRVVKTLDLENNQDFLNPHQGQQLTAWQNVRRLFGFYTPPPPPPPPPREIPDNKGSNQLKIEENTTLDSEAEAERLAPYVAKIKSGLDIAPVKDTRTSNRETRLIEIEFTHRDPQVAAKVANTIADVYMLVNLEQKVEANTSAGDFLQKRVSELQTQIRRDEERLVNYSRENQILALDGSQNTVIQKLTDLNVKLGQAENERIIAEIAYRGVLQNPNSGAIAESKDPRTGQIESNLLTLRQRLKQLKSEYTDEWIEVVEVRRQIESLEKELDESRKRASVIQSSTLDQAYREALLREKELRENFETQRNRVLSQNEAAITYRMIQQEIETNKKLFDNLLQKLKENDVILNGTPNNVFIVDRALTPNSPVNPQASKDILLACLGSLGLGIGLAFFRNWLDDTIRYTDDIEQQGRLPLLTTVPFGKRRLTSKIIGILSSSKTENPLNLDEPEIAEAFVKLRTYLLLMNKNVQTLVVTSADSGEGKTTTALNLAKVLAQSGKKVLLIDADLRMPRLHYLLDFSNNEGLTNLLIDSNINYQKIIRPVEDTNLHLLTAGPPATNPTNLLATAKMQKLMKIFAEEYSFIIVDSPPVLLFTDVVVISSLCDSVLMVVRDNHSSYQIFQQALHLLNSVRANVVGLVLNGVTDKSPFYNIRRYYGKEPLELSNNSNQ